MERLRAEEEDLREQQRKKLEMFQLVQEEEQKALQQENEMEDMKRQLLQEQHEVPGGAGGGAEGFAAGERDGGHEEATSAGATAEAKLCGNLVGKCRCCPKEVGITGG